eukprot:CAMPEP_0194063744 /NCGR_PEP_ID=MMETSP0009_2-20130614/81166_1 /TAXON_ID=210454 /ORGANISM="Grammatophora oceanica, Strain CCMP 410" /LENGTH=32 /DNA_ID= /DNA_START= /DNA_END= /DNA_ORIENTATION=
MTTFEKANVESLEETKNGKFTGLDKGASKRYV